MSVYGPARDVDARQRISFAAAIYLPSRSIQQARTSRARAVTKHGNMFLNSSLASMKSCQPR